MLQHLRFCLIGVLLLAPPGTPVKADGHPFIPSDAEFVLGLNVRQIIDSPLAKRFAPMVGPFAKNIPGWDDVLRTFADLGIDPFIDIDTVLIAGTAANRAEKGGGIVLNGRFDEAKILARADEVTKRHKAKLTIHEWEKRKVYELTFADIPPVYVAFVGKTTILVLNKEQLGVALRSPNGENRMQLSCKDLQDVVSKVDFKQALWFATSGPLFRKMVKVDGVEAKMANVRAVSAGISLAGDVKLAALVTNDTDVSAKELIKSIDASLMALKAQFGVDQRVAQVLDSVKVCAEQATVRITGQITLDFFEKQNSLER